MGHIIMAFIIRFEPTEGSTFVSFITHIISDLYNVRGR
jgi:hypothetical protein